jgi:hypothetical protein
LLDTALDYLQQDDEAGADYQPPSAVCQQAGRAGAGLRLAVCP